MNRNYPKIMGIINVTPDSFSDGGDYFDKNAAIQRAFEMINTGADILDIGGESTRPGSKNVGIIEELERVIPVIKGIRKHNKKIKISIDTTKSEVAEEAIKAGADIINDISGLTFDEDIAEVAAKFEKGLILMHILGTPQNMQKNPAYNDVVQDVKKALKEKIEYASAKGVKEIYADTGIGFGKTVDHNLELLRNHSEFGELEVPMVLGISRKSFFDKLFDLKDAKERDLPTMVAHAFLIQKNTDIIRVHNVKNAIILRNLYNFLN